MLEGDTGWFDSNDIGWSVPSARLGSLVGVCESAYLSNWQELTASTKTLYINYIQDSDDVEGRRTPIVGTKYPLPPFKIT